jgi:hypothetical protein
VRNLSAATGTDLSWRTVNGVAVSVPLLVADVPAMSTLRRIIEHGPRVGPSLIETPGGVCDDGRHR